MQMSKPAVPDYQIDEAMRLHKQGLSGREIARVLGISQTTVSRIARGVVRKSGDPDPMPVIDKVPGEYVPKPKKRLTRRITVSGSVLTATSEGETISISVCEQNGIRLSYKNFKAMCEDAALMLESMLEREQRGIYALE
jgi:DNA-binding MarR family transcriptional regulator